MKVGTVGHLGDFLACVGENLINIVWGISGLVIAILERVVGVPMGIPSRSGYIFLEQI